MILDLISHYVKFILKSWRLSFPGVSFHSRTLYRHTGIYILTSQGWEPGFSRRLFSFTFVWTSTRKLPLNHNDLRPTRLIPQVSFSFITLIHRSDMKQLCGAGALLILSIFISYIIISLSFRQRVRDFTHLVTGFYSPGETPTDTEELKVRRRYKRTTNNHIERDANMRRHDIWRHAPKSWLCGDTIASRPNKGQVHRV